jgi:hypothetical protein
MALCDEMGKTVTRRPVIGTWSDTSACRVGVSVCRTAMAQAGALVVICMAVVGCGDSHRYAQSSIAIRQHRVKYVSDGVRTLVRERLPGGEFSIIGQRYEYLGRSYFGLANRTEEPGEQRGAGGGGGGSPIEPGEHGVLVMEVEQGCVGTHEYVLADGLLRNSRDTVTSQGHGAPIEFKKVVIPASLHAGGVLVYALLTRGQSDVVTRTSNLRVMQDELITLKPLYCRRQ